MTTPQQDRRAGWIAGARAVLDAAEAHPPLPLPNIISSRATFYLTGHGFRAPRAFADAEAALSAALGVRFTLSAAQEDPWYTLEAVLPGGLAVLLRAPAADVAEKRVTGTAVTEVTEWVRLPAAPEGEVRQ
jgi:hypothetical protein